MTYLIGLLLNELLLEKPVLSEKKNHGISGDGICM